MHVIWTCHVLCGLVVASLCMTEVEYDDNYIDSYYNGISEDQQEGDSPTTTPCQAADLSRWDKLFIMLEDSHMRQNMLLESQENCCGGMVSLRSKLEKLAKGTCQQCVSRMESACRAQAGKESLALQRGLVELRREGAEREWRLNTTLQKLLHSRQEQDARLKRLEDGGGQRSAPRGPADSRMGHQATARPRGSGAKPVSSVLKEQDATPPLDVATMRGALVAIATELQRLHLQLISVLEQAGAVKKDRGDT